MNRTLFGSLSRSLSSTLLGIVFVLSTVLSFSASAEQITPIKSELSKQELIALQATNEDFLLLDVRTLDEFHRKHIPGAVNITHTEVADRVSEIAAYKNKNVIVYCRSGRRAAVAIDILKQKGFNHLSHLMGDMQGWNKTELPHKTH